MATAIRTQKRYDHRLREFVRSTQDISYAVQHGVPPSTAHGWLNASTAEVVTVDVLKMDAIRLQQEVLLLRARIQKLTTRASISFRIKFPLHRPAQRAVAGERVG